MATPQGWGQMKKYVDDDLALKLALVGGTMTGDIVMGSNKVTSTATPATDDTLTRKKYVDDGLAGKLNSPLALSTTDVRLSRAPNTTYQNTSGKHMLLMVGASEGSYNVRIGPTSPPTIEAAHAITWDDDVDSKTVLIPNGWYYRLDGTPVPCRIWIEQTWGG